MIKLIIFIVIGILFLIAGITLLVRTLKQEKEEQEAEEVLNDDTITVIGSDPLSEERIEQIRQDTENTQDMIKCNEFNSKIKPLKEYLVHIEEQHNAGQISDEDYKKELECMNDTITKFEQEYNIKLEEK